MVVSEEKLKQWAKSIVDLSEDSILKKNDPVLAMAVSLLINEAEKMQAVGGGVDVASG